MGDRKLIVIIDGGPGGDHVAEWQRQALASLQANDRLMLLVCTNTRLKRSPLRFPLYYALNFITVRNPLTRPVPLRGLAARLEERLEFASEQDGAWQVLPQHVIETIAASGAAAVIKLGMGLMRVPAELKVPILSWHHGDPEHFRGRPAGFWELLTGHSAIGQVVQVIGNKLDAGAVVAFAETRAVQHSWRATLIESFRHSPLLLAPALDNAIAGRSLAKRPSGKNYRLPSNGQVLRLLAQLGYAKLKRWVYGGLFEKRWRVSTAPVAASKDAVAVLTGYGTLPPESTWTTPPPPPGYSFIADPFFAATDDTLLVEALSARSGKGEILRINGQGGARLSYDPGHHSYPALVEEAGESYCVPEIAQWSQPAAYRWQDGWERVTALDVEGIERLTDPTFHRHDERLYLFANDARWGSGVLRLWSADGLFGRFTEHPASPIRISPRGSRMGGALLPVDGKLLRIGQDGSGDYGNGLIVFAIDELTPGGYREREVGAFHLADRKGPHTFNLSPEGGKVLFDWYRDQFSPLAGFRRIISRLR